MMRRSQRLLVLVLVALMAASSQAEICPMKLQSQQSDVCARPMAHVRHTAHPATGHECCPSGHGTGHAQAAMQAKYPPAQLTACNSQMTCCSLDPQPAGSTKSAQVVQSQAAVAPRIAAAPPLARVAMVSSGTTLNLDNSVFRHKEDLRI